MVHKLNCTDFIQTRNNLNGTLTPKGFFEDVTNIGMGKTFIKQKDQLVTNDGAAKRNGWLVAAHVIGLSIGSVFSLIALSVREIIRAVDRDYELRIVSKLKAGQGNGVEIGPVDPVGGGGCPGLSVCEQAVIANAFAIIEGAHRASLPREGLDLHW